MIEQNNAVFFERWQGFRERYEYENNLINPIKNIELEIFPAGNPVKNETDKKLMKPFEYIFSIKNSINNNFKVITIFGLKLKIKKY